MSIYSAEQLGELSKNLGAIADWLHDKCEARHADDMGDVVDQAVTVLEDFYDEATEREAASRTEPGADVQSLVGPRET